MNYKADKCLSMIARPRKWMKIRIMVCCTGYIICRACWMKSSITISHLVAISCQSPEIFEHLFINHQVNTKVQGQHISFSIPVPPYLTRMGWANDLKKSKWKDLPIRQRVSTAQEYERYWQALLVNLLGRAFSKPHCPGICELFGSTSAREIQAFAPMA